MSTAPWFRWRTLKLAFVVALVSVLSACDDDSNGDSPVPTATATAARTNTSAPTSTPTESPVPAATSTLSPTVAATSTSSPVPTLPPTATASVPPTATATAVPTSTLPPVPTATATAVVPPTATATATEVPSATETATPTNTATPVPAIFSAFGSVRQLYVLDGEPNEPIELRDAQDTVIATGTTDARGALLFRDLEPGPDYVIHATARALSLPAVRVLAADEHPDPSFYASQQIGEGYGYLRTRDGVLLAINVSLPGPAEEGPYPTVVEYSGYDPANPDFPQPSTLIATSLGYAAVGVNMRGTGCSGGAFDYFETLQSLDGYDAIEAIAAQPWVKGNKVGTVGISYPGITQLFVGATQPPSLAAIAPLSVISDIGRGILYPGGILNDGFAVEWADERRRESQPGGQPWSQKRMDEGDQICIANQKLRGQNPDILEKIDQNNFYVPAVAAPLSPSTFVDRIKVPVFLTGAWQDEQTGGYFPNMLGDFTGSPSVHFSLTNGGHIEAVDPENLGRWMEFLSLYVAKEIPRVPFEANAVLQVAATSIFGVRNLRLPADRFGDVTTYEAAVARFEADPRLRILFENGGGAVPGAPMPTFIREFSAWPIPETTAQTWYFDADARLSESAPSGEGADTFIYDTSRSQLTTLEGTLDQVWRALPPFEWPHPQAGKAVAYATDPLDETLVMVGTGSIDLWLGSTAPDVDVQVTLSELRPDGKEVFVQSGWLRASRRKLDAALTTELRPVSTHLREDAAPLPEGELAEVRVELFPFAHVFRAGSQLRIVVDTPGGSRPRWRFDVLEYDEEVVNTVARSAAAPSKIVLPVIPGVDVPAALPACPGLRGQPCRTTQEWSNTAE